MDTHTQNYLNMCRRVSYFYTANEQALAEAQKLSACFKEFITMVRQFKFEFEKSIAYVNQYTIERAQKRSDLEADCLNLCRLLHDQGIDDESLKYRCTEASIIQLDEEELIDYASTIHRLSGLSQVQKVVGATAQPLIENLSKHLMLFVLTLPQHRMNIELRKTFAVAALKSKEKIDDFVGFTLDKEIGIIRNSNPNLYKLYYNARVVIDFNLSTTPHFEGVVNGAGIHHITSLPFNPYREFRVQVCEGNAIWGLSDHKEEITYCRPITVLDNLSIRSGIIGAGGDHLLIQAVSADKPLYYKVWMSV
ncbi:MAG: hypothetical protein V4613_01190 [Bacteroidota bacterium]